MGAHGESEEQGCARARQPASPFAKLECASGVAQEAELHGAVDRGVTQLPPSWWLSQSGGNAAVAAAAAAMLERAHPGADARGRARAQAAHR